MSTNVITDEQVETWVSSDHTEKNFSASKDCDFGKIVMMSSTIKIFLIPFNRMANCMHDWFWCLIFGISPCFSSTHLALLLELFSNSVHIFWTQCRFINKINHAHHLATCEIWQRVKIKFKNSNNLWNSLWKLSLTDSSFGTNYEISNSWF